MLNGIISVCNVLVQALCTRTLELERLKSDWSSYTATLTSEHSSSLNSERARALDTQATAQVGFEQEKKNMELAHQAKVRVSGREWKGRGRGRERGGNVKWGVCGLVSRVSYFIRNGPGYHLFLPQWRIVTNTMAIACAGFHIEGWEWEIPLGKKVLSTP